MPDRPPTATLATAPTGPSHRTRLAALVVALATAVATLASSATPRPAEAASDGAPMLLGLAYGGDWRAELDDFAAKQGKPPAFFQIFWNNAVFDQPHVWAGGILSDLHDRGITAWVEWTTDDLAAMAAGQQDDRIRNFFAAIDDFLLGGASRSLVVAPLPESNLDEWGWCCDPIAYQKAFRRMRVLADEAGLGPEHVRFAFSMNGLSSRGRSYDQFYPGDEHVDLLAFSRLNRGNGHPDGWRDYDDVFGFPIGDMASLVGTSKPIVVAQTGTVDDASGDRDQWLRDLFTRLPGEDQVIGAIYFNRDKDFDYRIHEKAGGVPLHPEVKSGYATWSPSTAADWLFDGSLDDWVAARGGSAAVWPPRTDDPPPATNIFSDDFAVTTRVGAGAPIANAVAISRARFSADTAAHVVLSRDDKFPDALAGTPLLGDGPLLLTPTSALDAAVRGELDRVLPTGGRVYLLGGPGALATGIEDELLEAGYDVRRLHGSDRFQTARQIALEVVSLYPESADTVLVARGFGTATNPTAAWADSVTGGGFAAASRHPVVLSASHELSPEAAEVVDGRARAVLLGGPGALGDRVLADAGALATSADRVAGTARDLTAVAILTDLWRKPTGEFRLVVIDGYSEQGWAYGLPAAGLSADFDAPLLPVAPNALPGGTAAAVRSCFSKRVATAVVGTSAVVSDAVLQSVEAHDHSC